MGRRILSPIAFSIRWKRDRLGSGEDRRGWSQVVEQPTRKPGPSPRSANWGCRILAGVRSEMDRTRRFTSKPKTRDHDQSLFAPARRPEARQVRDDSPAQQRPKWVSAVKSPLRGGAAFLIAAGTAPPSPRCVDSTATVAVPETTPRSPWLVDPIREHCRRFWRINGLRRGTIDDVPSV